MIKVIHLCKYFKGRYMKGNFSGIELDWFRKKPLRWCVYAGHYFKALHAQQDLPACTWNKLKFLISRTTPPSVRKGKLEKNHINTLPFLSYLYLLSPVSLIDYVHLFSYTVAYPEVFPPPCHPWTIILIPCTRSLTINNFKSPLIIFSSNENSGHSQFSL